MSKVQTIVILLVVTFTRITPADALHIRTQRTGYNKSTHTSFNVCGLTCENLIGDVGNGDVIKKNSTEGKVVIIPKLKPSLCGETTWGPFAKDIIRLKVCDSADPPDGFTDSSTFGEICKTICDDRKKEEEEMEEANFLAYKQGNNSKGHIELLHEPSTRSLFRNNESTNGNGKWAIPEVTVVTKYWGYENSWMIQKKDEDILGGRNKWVDGSAGPDSPGKLCYGGINNDNSPSNFWSRKCCWYGDGIAYEGGSGWCPTYQGHNGCSNTDENFEHTCQEPLTPGEYQITCGCAYGDGWHGGYVHIPNVGNFCRNWYGSSTTETFTIYEHQTTWVAGVGGDPHATNLAGKKFEILQVGTFPLVEIRAARFASFSPYLAVSAGINHVESDCGPTYIQNVSLSGQWVSELADTSGVQVRVVHWVPKAEALQVRINDEEHEWQPVSRAKQALSIVSKVTESQVNFHLHKVTVHVSLGLNERKVDKAQGYNFLNVNLRGLDATDTNMKLSGLIINDDVSALSKAPEKCQAAHFSMGAGQADTTFLSYITLGTHGKLVDQVHDADQEA